MRRTLQASGCVAVIAFAALTVFARGAYAETLMERGEFLALGIVACGNCHTRQALWVTAQWTGVLSSANINMDTEISFDLPASLSD